MLLPLFVLFLFKNFTYLKVGILYKNRARERDKGTHTEKGERKWQREIREKEEGERSLTH